MKDKKKSEDTPKSNKIQQQKKLLLECLEKHYGIVTAACKSANLDRTTYYRYYKEDPELKEAVDEFSDVALDFAEEKLMKQIKDLDTTATIFYLKTKGKKRGYVEKKEIDTNLNQPIIFQNVSKEHD